MYFENENYVIDFAYYILENQTTIRATANHFNAPKSTVHNDLNTKLKRLNPELYYQVKKLLIHNFNIKHIHGGESTKMKYEKLKSIPNRNDEIEMMDL